MTSLSSLLSTSNNAAQPQATALTPNPPPSSASSNGSLSFGDVMDALNPLQHIPVVSSLYRAATGTQISSTSQIAGDTLYGGVFGLVSAATGFVSSVANVAVKSATGQDIGQHVMASLGASSSTQSTSPAAVVTPLVPSSATTPSVTATNSIGDTSTFVGQIANANRILSHTGSGQSSAQYQRTQTLDAVNQHLLHMTS